MARRRRPKTNRPKPKTIEERIVIDLDGCWIWSGAKTSNGLPVRRVDGVKQLVKRAMYFEAHPDRVKGSKGQKLGWQCKRLCVHPGHHTLPDGPVQLDIADQWDESDR